ncbi:MAG: PsbP-related protein [Nitrososphaerales archaeon]
MIEKERRAVGLLISSVFVAGVLSPSLIAAHIPEAAFAATQTNDFLTYYNSEYEIKIKYPAEWQTIEPEDDYVKAVFYSPPEGVSDPFSELVMILIEDLPFKMKLTDYTELAIRQMRASYPDMQILTSGPAELAGNPAHKIVFTGTVEDYEDINIKGMMIWTIQDKKAYIVGFIAEVEQYSTYLQTAQTMVDSFEIVS